MRVVEALQGGAVGQGDGLALVAVAEQGEQGGQGVVADAEDLLPDGALELVQGGAVAGGLLHQGAQGLQGIAQFGIEDIVSVCHAHGRVPL